jgi:polysaccharide biosynthesis protein PslH
LKLLFISTWFPSPLDTGARIRVHYLLKTLAHNHSVDFIGFMPDLESEFFLPELRDWCSRVEVVRRSPFWQDPSKKYSGHFSLVPRDVLTTFSPEMAEITRRILQAFQHDVVICSIENVAPYALPNNGTPMILEEHNFMSSWMEERFRTQTSLLKKLAGWITWQKCRRYERWLFPQFDACSMVSDKDCQAVRAAIPACKGRVHMIPNGVDVEYHQPGLLPPVQDTLVFNGPLSYYANADAVQFFLSEIMPLIQKHRPDVHLSVTGRTDGVNLNELPLDHHVKVTGFLDDVRPAIAQSWACIVPLRIGGGSRLKILQAMALGTPVVSTSKGAEGLDVTNEREILIADEPDTFANQTLRLLEDLDLRARLARNGRTLVEAKYSWVEIGKSFSTFVEEVASERDTRRRLFQHAS